MNISQQEIFNKVTNHLITQGVRSVSEDGLGCLYRGPNNLMCAVGCLIPVEVYSEKFEGFSVYDLIENFPETLNIFGEENIDLIGDLQATHDLWDGTKDHLINELKFVANKYNLSKPVL